MGQMRRAPRAVGTRGCGFRNCFSSWGLLLWQAAQAAPVAQGEAHIPDGVPHVSQEAIEHLASERAVGVCDGGRRRFPATQLNSAAIRTRSTDDDRGVQSDGLVADTQCAPAAGDAPTRRAHPRGVWCPRYGYNSPPSKRKVPRRDRQRPHPAGPPERLHPHAFLSGLVPATSVRS
jgi:hypothetical protein